MLFDESKTKPEHPRLCDESFRLLDATSQRIKTLVEASNINEIMSCMLESDIAWSTQPNTRRDQSRCPPPRWHSFAPWRPQPAKFLLLKWPIEFWIDG